MTNFLRTAAVALALVGAGCGLLQKKSDDGGSADSGGGGGADQGQTMLDMMKGQQTQYVLQLPPGAKVGSWWEHTMAGTTKMKYSIVGQKDDQLIVEQAQDMGGTTLVNAWQVDPSVDLTKMPADGQPMPHNVTKAWVGLPGKAGEERPVMAVPTYQKGEGGAAGEKPQEGDESVTMGGKSWDAHWVATSAGKTWMAKGGTFLLKSQDGAGTVNMELTGWGEDAAAALKWE